MKSLHFDRPPLFIRLVLASFAAGLIPARWQRGVWRRILPIFPGLKFVHQIPVGTRSFSVMALPGINDSLILDGLQDYDSEVFAALRNGLVGSTPVIIDVGGNIGQYVLRFKALWPDAAIHTFEPFPKLAATLEAMAKLNCWLDVWVNRKVAGATAGNARLYFDGLATETASTVAGFQPTNRHSLDVECISLDGYIETMGMVRVDILKIDVEGGELEVIQGATLLLEKLRPLVLLELLWTNNPEHSARQKTAIALLHAAGYHFHMIKSDGALEFQANPQPDPHYRLLNFLVSSDRH